MREEQIYANARIVLADEVVLGSIVVRDGLFASIDPGSTSVAGAHDLDGDFLTPGLVEIHTDNLERHVMPRPRVQFPMQGAVRAHDAEIASAGITTVLDAIGVGDPYDDGFRARDQSALLDVLDRLEAAGSLRVDHHIHVRCELPAPNALALFEPFMHHRRLRLISLMDHTPGQRQWTDTSHARIYYTGKKNWSDAKFDEEMRIAPERQKRYAEPHRQWFSSFARANGLVLATHDDTTVAHVEEAFALGATMSEFPTTRAAALQARHRGLCTVAGAPNVVRGGSHSGNVSALDLARDGTLDALSSDYVPSSLMLAAWQLTRDAGYALDAALRIVSLHPAIACGLTDRGCIQVGLRADWVRVRELADGPVVREVHARGSRIA